MKVSIQSMRLENFKGIKSKEVIFDGKDANVCGMNGTGKTSIFDAFTWCLFGKDSQDKADFWVKPHDKDGNEIHNLETLVNLLLNVDGKEMRFSRMLVENWVKKNGQADRVFSGNSTKYWVNGISVSAGEYTKSVEKIVTPEVFLLIANPMAFNAIKREKRREFLVKLCNADIDTDLLAKPEYSVLAEEMAKHSTDVYGVKKLHTERRKRDNEEMMLIPARYSEFVSIVDSLGECDTVEAEKRKQVIDGELKVLELASTGGAELVEKVHQAAQELAQQEKRKQEVLAKMERVWQEAGNKARLEAMRIKSELEYAERAVSDCQKRLDMLEAQKQAKEKEVADLRQEWHSISQEQMEETTVDTVCPVCGQQLPFDQLEAVKAKAVQTFQQDKKARLAKVSERGKAESAEVKELTETINKVKIEYQLIVENCAELTPKLDTAEGTALQYSQEPVFSADSEIVAIQQTIDQKRQQYEKLLSQQKAPDAKIEERKRQLWQEKSDLAKVEANKGQKDICTARMEALSKRQEELGIQIADTEQFLMLIEDFIMERCKALEEKVNYLFPTVRWKLFETQINGGIKDCCNCMVDGVQYENANNAGRVNAGLEITQVLSKHYGVNVPVFIDNAEAVNQLYAIDSQCIALTVTDDDKEIRIEGRA